MEDIPLMDNRHRNSLRPISRCNNAAIAIALLAIVLMGFQVHVTNRRRIGSDYASPILCCCREP